MIQHFHQLLAAGARCIVIKQVKLCDTLAEEVSQHYSCFLVSVSVFPDGIKASCGRCYDVPAVLHRCQQLNRGAVTVIWLIKRKWRCFDERGNEPTILVFSTQLLRCPRRVATDSLPHCIVISNTFTERPTAYNLLLYWRKLFQFKTRFTAQLAHSPLQYHIEVLSDKPDVGISQVENRLDPHSFELFGNSTAGAPGLINRKCRHQLALPINVRQVNNSTRLSLPSFRGVICQFRQRLGLPYSHTNSKSRIAIHRILQFPTKVLQYTAVPHAAKVTESLVY